MDQANDDRVRPMETVAPHVQRAGAGAAMAAGATVAAAKAAADAAAKAAEGGAHMAADAAKHTAQAGAKMAADAVKDVSFLGLAKQTLLGTIETGVDAAKSVGAWCAGRVGELTKYYGFTNSSMSWFALIVLPIVVMLIATAWARAAPRRSSLAVGQIASGPDAPPLRSTPVARRDTPQPPAFSKRSPAPSPPTEH